MRIYSSKTADSVRVFAWRLTRPRQTTVRLGLTVLVGLVIGVGLWRSRSILQEDNARAFLHQNYNDMLFRYHLLGFKDYRSLLIGSFTSAAVSQLDRLLSNEQIPSFNLNIDFNSLQAIREKRRRALQGGEYQERDAEYFKASINYKGENIPVRIRLKGGRLDHLSDPKKWSYRVKTRRDSRLFGMKSFSLQGPHTRSYQFEPVYLRSMRDHGIISVRYSFADVRVNGEPIGLMAVEEHFAKELLESQQRREGVLFKISDNRIPEIYFALKEQPVAKKLLAHIEAEIAAGRLAPVYRNLVLHVTGPFAGIGLMYMNARNLPVEVFEPRRVAVTPQLAHQRRIGRGLFRAAVHGLIPAAQVFDTDKFGRYFAVQWMWNVAHAASFRNQRFYFNPITFRFEPIAFDSAAFMPDGTREIAFDENRFDTQITRIIFSAPETLSSFREHAERLYSEVIHNNYLKELRVEEKEQLRELQSEFQLLPAIPFETLKSHMVKSINAVRSDSYFTRSKRIEVKTNLPADLRLPAVVNAYHVEDDSGVYLELANILAEEAVVSEIWLESEGERRPVAAEKLPLTLAATIRDKAPHLARLKLAIAGLSGAERIGGRVRPKSQQLDYEFSARRYDPILKEHPIKSEAIDRIIREFPFIKASGAVLKVEPGRWTVQRMIIPPRGTGLEIGAGTELAFSTGAGFIMRGPVRIMGAVADPVVLRAEHKSWSGLSVLEADAPSQLEYVEIYGTDFAQKDGWKLTGGVNFYQSDVNLREVLFKGSEAEDALNVIRSSLSMQQVKIEDTRSDAFDGDFVKGTISGCTFKNVGGDAVDLSGSDLVVQDVSFDTVGDKALSIGERSKALITGVKVSSAGTAVVSKDDSDVQLSQSEFKEIRYATLMAYQKKPEFAGARLAATDLIYESGDDVLVSQRGSRMTVDGLRIPNRKLDIQSLYSQGYMKKE